MFIITFIIIIIIIIGKKGEGASHKIISDIVMVMEDLTLLYLASLVAKGRDGFSTLTLTRARTLTLIRTQPLTLTPLTLTPTLPLP